MNNKGSVMDAAPILWFLFFAAFTALCMLLIVNTVNDDFQLDDSIPQTAKDIISSGATQAPKIYDFWFTLLFVGLPLISAVFAYFNNIHPLFFWISLIFVVVVIFVGAGISQLWSELIDDSLLSTQADLMPMTNFILSNFGFYSFFVFIVIASGTFVKLRGRDTIGGF